MDGFEVYEQLQEMELTSDITVIFLSVLSETENIVRGLDLNAVDYITKPFQPMEVVARVEKHLALRNLRLELEEKNAQLSREIEDRIAAENALRVERDNFFNILESMPDGIYIVDQDYNVQYANSALKEEFGLEEGRKCFNYFYNREEICSWCQNPKVFDGETIRWEWISERNQKIYDLIGTPLMNPDGSVWKLEIFLDVTDRKQTEDALRESERAMATLISNLPGMAYRAKNDPNWTMEFLSDGCLLLTGYTPAAFIENAELAYAEIIHPDDQKYVWHEVQKAVQERRTFQLTYRIKTRNGQEKWVWEQGQAVYNPQGESQALEGFVTDITDRKHAEQALETSEEQYRQLVEKAGVGIVMDDLDGVIQYYNERASELFGYSMEEMKSQSIQTLLHPDDLEWVEEYHNERIQGNEAPQSYSCKGIRKDGSTVYLEVNAVPLKDDGNITGTRVYLWDISDSVLVELALRESEERLALAFDVSNSGVWEFNPLTFTDTYLSDRWFAMLGYEPDEHPQAAKTWIKLVHPEDLERVLQKVQDLTIENNDYSAEFRMKTKVGDYCWIRSVGKIVSWDSEDNPQRMIGLQIDITERKLMEDALRKSERNLTKAQQVTKVGYFEWDLDANSTTWSDEMYRIFGVDKKTYTPTFENFAELVHPDDLDVLSQENVKNTIRLENHELDFRVIDQTTNEIKHVHLWGETTFDNDGEPVLILGTVQNITDHITIQDALNEKSSYLFNILSSATDDAIVTTDLDYLITYFNPVAEKFYGISADQAIGKSIAEIRTVNPTDEAFNLGLANLHERGEHHYETVVEIEGQERNIHSRLSGIFSPEGDLIGYARFSRDVTDSIHAENVLREIAVLEERQRLADDLHDAVTQILFSASLIADVLPRVWVQNPDDGMQNLLKLRHLTREALLEMRMLLLEIRPDSLIEKDLADLLRQLSNTLTTRTGIPINVYLEGKYTPPPEVQVALYRIVQETLNNITKHAEATQVTIKMHRQDGKISLSIKDDGIGFSHDAVTPGNLGMIIMRERAEKVGAALSVESTIGKGTLISVSWEKEL